MWAFLEGVKSSGSPLPRSVIVARCQKDTALLTTICQVARSALTLLSVDGNNKPKSAVVAGADRILSFFTATIVEVADKGSLDDSQLRTLYPFLLEGLKKSVEGSEENKNGSGKFLYRVGGPADQWRRSSCMIIAQICQKTRMAKPLLKNIIGALMYSFVKISGISHGPSGSLMPSQAPNTGLDAAIEIVTIVSVIAQNQKVSMGPKMLLAMFSDISESSNSSIESSSSSPSSSSLSSSAESPENVLPPTRIASSYLIQCIQILQKSKGFDASALLKVMTTTLSAALVYQVEEKKNFAESSFLSPMMASKILAYCISSGMLTDGNIGSIVWKILQNNSLLSSMGQSLLNAKTRGSAANGRKERSESFSDDNDGDRKEVLRVLRCVSQRYPSIFDSCVQAAYNEVKNDGLHTQISDNDEVDIVIAENALEEDDKEDDDDDDDELQIGKSLRDIQLEKEAKASSLRQLLSDTFTDAPYRMPNDSGVSLMISLSHTSPLIRIAAVETFTMTVPLDCESTPDVRGLAQAASLLLTDPDHTVAISAWGVDTVLRITSHITSQELLECAINAFNYWSECMSRVPVRASRILKAILLALSECPIAKSLCSARTTSFGSIIQGDNWLYVTVLSCAMDGVYSSVKEEDNELENSEKKIKTLQYTALCCAKMLGDDENLLLFNGISAVLLEKNTVNDVMTKYKNKSKIDDDTVKDSNFDVEDVLTFDSLVKSIAISLCGVDFTTKFQLFHSASLCFLSKSVDTITNRLKSSTYIAFMDSISTHLITILEEKSSDKMEVLNVLQFFTALSTSLVIHFIKTNDTKEKMPLSVMTALNNIISRAQTIGISNITGDCKLENVPDLILEGSKKILANDIGSRIILTVLSSKISSIAALAGSCLGNFFGINPSLILFRIALSSQICGGVPCDDLNYYYPLNHTQKTVDFTDFGAVDYTDSYLEISPKARSEAISALSQYISAYNIGAIENEINVSLSSLLIAIVPLMIGCCCDENKIVRNSGLLLGKALMDLRPQFQLTTQNNKKKQSIKKNFQCVISMTVVELIAIGYYITSSAAVISLDSLTIPNLLSQKIFRNSEMDIDTPGFEGPIVKMKTLANSILSLGALYGWEMPFISIPIITAASAAPFESFWPYLQYLLSYDNLSTSSTVNESKDLLHRKLSKAIIRCIATAHTARDEVKSLLIESISQLILKVDRTDGTYIRDDIFQLIGEGWALKFSNENRSILFRSLLTEQVRTCYSSSLDCFLVLSTVMHFISLSYLPYFILHFIHFNVHHCFVIILMLLYYCNFILPYLCSLTTFALFYYSCCLVYYQLCETSRYNSPIDWFIVLDLCSSPSNTPDERTLLLTVFTDPSIRP